jgi:Homeodomain
MALCYDLAPSGQNMEVDETPFKPSVSGTQAKITTNKSLSILEVTGPTQEASTGFPEAIDLTQEASTTFSEVVREFLNEAFSMEHYPSPTAIVEISRRTNLKAKQVRTWFVNKRSRSTKKGSTTHITP